MVKFSGNIDGVSFFITLTGFFQGANNISTNILPDNCRGIPTREKQLCSHYKSFGVLGRDSFHMDNKGSQTCEEESALLLDSSTNGDLSGPMISTPRLVERTPEENGMQVFQSEMNHDGLNTGSAEHAAHNTDKLSWNQWEPYFEDDITFLHLNAQILNALAVLFCVSLPQEHFNNYMAFVKNDRLFYIKINFDYSSKRSFFRNSKTLFEPDAEDDYTDLLCYHL